MAKHISARSILDVDEQMRIPLVVTLILLLLTAAAACRKVSSDSSTQSTQSTQEEALATAPLAGQDIPIELGAIDLSSESGSTIIKTNSSLKLRIELITKSGQPLSGRALINFELSDPTLGRITSPIEIIGGLGSVDFSSKEREGIITIIAKSLNANIEGRLDIQISNLSPPAQVQISADPNRISINGTSHIKVTVMDLEGRPVKDGTQVTFGLSNSSFGSITESALTINGKVSATFVAAQTSGEVTIWATAGEVSNTVTVNIASAEVGSIEFVSAEPNVIGLKGSGQVEVSAVTFMVKNSQGTPVQEAKSVLIELFGPGGGEYLEEEGQSEIRVSTERGAARVNVHSGVIAGTVTLRATVSTDSGTSLSTSSGIISIGGGKPTESHVSLSASTLNLEGLAYYGIESQITVRLADRYGNVEVLKGTTVSFYSESGGIQRSAIMDDKGCGSVIFRTQSPIPHKTLPNDNEIAFMNQLNFLFGIPIDTDDPHSPNPRDGLCTIVAVVDGEEKFTDGNANGQYDLGESYDDTYDDIFLDKDDNSIIDTDFEDLIIDRDGNLAFDGYNGQWDGNKKIYKTFNLLITGKPRIFTDFEDQLKAAGGENFVIVGNTKLYFHVFVGDENYNPPIAGTSYSVSVSGGAGLEGVASYKFPDTNSSLGGPIFSYCLYDVDPADTDPPKRGEVKISVTWRGREESIAYSIPVD
ncbi:MAG: Ig-like domain-containing protein [bacterium]|nr:Ig-like domain-containing protein [bacterium]